MFSKYIRIQVEANASYLVYQRGLITEYAKIEKTEWRHTSAIELARQELRYNIRNAKDALRDTDKLASKGSEAILRMLKIKRRKFASQCLESKAPANKSKHVGVEIEFISSSDRDDIALDLAALGLEKYVELKRDGSVSGGSSDDCDGSCREDCTCAECGDMHYCDDETDCNRRSRNYEGRNVNRWEYRENCTDCSDTEYLEDCDCGGQDAENNSVCNGEHVICSGHCEGHHCVGYDDHNDYDCNCECNCSSDNGHEIAIVAKSTEIKDIIRKVCKVLHDHSAEINNTCGLHVHIDARGRDEKRMFANLVKAQKLLYSMVPRSRYNNSYCQPNKSGYDMSAYHGRYWGINPKSYNEHKTIEVRLHSGTINAEKINNWIELLQKIAYSKSVKEIESLNDLTSKVKLNAKLVEYIIDRVEKFSTEHGRYSISLNDTTEQLAA